MSKGLTDIAIRNLRPKETRREIPDPGARGLYVVIQPSGKTSFAVRYRHAGSPRKLTLKSGIALSAARKMAADAMHEVAQGRDPAEAKEAAKVKAILAKADTVQAICEDFLKREGTKLRTVDDRRQAFERLVYPVIGDAPISTLKRSQIVRLLDKIEDENGDRMADLVLAYLRKALNWHAGRSDDFNSPIVKGMGRYNGKANAGSRVLTDDELRAIWKASDPDGKNPFHALVRFLLLTGARRNEARFLKWPEIEGSDWLLPAARNKVKVDLTRPLSKDAQAVIAEQARVDDGPFVFTNDGHRPLSMSKPKVGFDKACGVKGWKLHDLRRTARTLMSRAGVNADVAERCLGHVIGGVRGVYDKHTFHHEMQIAFDALAAQIENIVNPPPATVLKFKPKRGRA